MSAISFVGIGKECQNVLSSEMDLAAFLKRKTRRFSEKSLKATAPHCTAVGRSDFPKNLSASLFNGDQSNKPNFSLIHLAGHYL
jgi:hypothetical protein